MYTSNTVNNNRLGNKRPSIPINTENLGLNHIIDCYLFFVKNVQYFARPAGSISGDRWADQMAPSTISLVLDHGRSRGILEDE